MHVVCLQDQPHVNQDTRLDNRIIDLRVSYNWVRQVYVSSVGQ